MSISASTTPGPPAERCARNASEPSIRQRTVRPISAIQAQMSQPTPTESSIDRLEFAQLEATVAQLQMQSLAQSHGIDPADFATLQGIVVEIQSQLAKDHSHDPQPGAAHSVSFEEFQALRAQVTALEEELQTIRHTLAQVVGFLKRKAN